MKKVLFIFVLLTGLIGAGFVSAGNLGRIEVSQVTPASLASDLSGKILLQVQDHGEAWYIYPSDLKRYYLRDGDAAYTLMRFLSLGITTADLELIPSVADTTAMNNSSSACWGNSLASRLKGKILLQVESHGEAWYIDTDKCRRIYLKDGAAAYDIMRFLGLGITNADLARLPISPDSVLPEGVTPPPAAVGEYEKATVNAQGVNYSVDILKIDLNTPGLEIITDSANNTDCLADCITQPLETFVSNNNGFAGLHGSYFCPSMYSGCVTHKNSYDFPIYDSPTGFLINQRNLPWPTTGGMMIFDVNNRAYFLQSTQSFNSQAEFEASIGAKIQAVIGNIPPLVVNGVNIVGQASLDDKQRNTKSSRGGIAIKGNTVYLIIAHSATVVDLANIMEALQVDQGLNLDGGGSVAMYYEGEYKVGPGRNLPNAIIFRQGS